MPTKTYNISQLERDELVNLLVELQQTNSGAELYMEINEGLSILGYYNEPEDVELDYYEGDDDDDTY